MKVTAKSVRSGSWWAVEVPEVPGAFTQAKRLDQVPAMVADAVAMLTGTEPSQIEVIVTPELSEEVRGHIEHAQQLREESARSNSEAAAEVRAAAKALASAGLPLRDIGTILGVSYQRAHQLLDSAA